MRLKNININERSTSYLYQEQKTSLQDMSALINQIGDVFDNMVQLENFLLQKINEDLSTLVGIKENKDSIVEKEGLINYLNNYFSPSVYNVENKIKETINEWDVANDRLSSEDIKTTIRVLKEISIVLKGLENKKYKSVDLINKLIDEFGYFQIIRVVFIDDIVDRINVLIQLKKEIQQVFSPPEKDEPKKPEERRKKLTIDDL